MIGEIIDGNTHLGLRMTGEEGTGREIISEDIHLYLKMTDEKETDLRGEEATTDLTSGTKMMENSEMTQDQITDARGTTVQEAHAQITKE